MTGERPVGIEPAGLKLAKARRRQSLIASGIAAGLIAAQVLTAQVFTTQVLAAGTEKQKAAPAPAPPPGVETKPYDPGLMRLAEILGALGYLGNLCGNKDAAAWHARMQALIDAEGTSPARKDRLAGAYNSGIQGYALSYRSCTPNARLIIDRFLAEALRIAKTLENRFGAT